jgi:hypothetical protein
LSYWLKVLSDPGASSEDSPRALGESYPALGVITTGSDDPAAVCVPEPTIVHCLTTHDIAQPCRLLHPGVLAGVLTFQCRLALIVTTPAKLPPVWVMIPVHALALVHETVSSVFAPLKGNAYSADQ